MVTPFSYASVIKDSEFKSIDERLNPPKNLKAILVPVVANVSFLLNALNIDMAKIFSEKLQKWSEDQNIQRVLLFGEGKHFCAGGDVKSLFLMKDKNRFIFT